MKEKFLNALRIELINRYGIPGKGMDSWACDEAKLNQFMSKTEETINSERNIVNIDSDSFRAAWKSIGQKGKPSYKALRALA